MKGLDKGPKIELSKLKAGNLKVPGAVRELWNDLRSQRLLPVVAILIVGLVAIPVLLGGSSKSEPEAGANPTAPAPAETSAQDLVVAKFAPGLRDYRLRYKHLKATSPFATPKVSSKAGETGGESGESPASPELTESTEPGGGSEAGPTESTEPPIEESPATEPGEGSHGPRPREEAEKAEKAEKEAEDVTIDVRVTTLHLDGTSSESVRRNVEKLGTLPSKAVPALAYAGPSEDGKSAMVAVSSEVTDLLGKGACVTGGEPCKLLELKLGQPETLVFGPRGLTYRVELVRIGTHILSADNGTAKGNPPPAKGGGNQEKSSPSEDGGGKLEHLGRSTIAIGN